MSQPAFSERFVEVFEIQEAIAFAARNSPSRGTARLTDVLVILRGRNASDDKPPAELEAAIRSAAEEAGVRIVP